MSGKAKKNLALILVTAYCAVSWAAMSFDYWTAGDKSSQTQQFLHLVSTVVVLLAVIVWKGHSIEGFIARLSALPKREGFAPFAAVAALFLTMLNYPRSQSETIPLAEGLMESTRALVTGLFAAGAVAGLTGLVALNARAVSEAVLRISERLIFRAPQRIFVVCVMLIVFLETNAISYFQFHHVPVCSDEVNYIFQAKIFASGRLYAEPPQYPEAFRFASFVLGDKWYSIVAPGFPLLLVPGVFLGATWAVNPVLAALCVMLVYLIAKRIYDERIARGSAALMLVSPFLLMLSSVQLSHISAMFFFLLFLYFLLKGLDGKAGLQWALAGLALGGMAMTRPLTAIVASLPWGFYVIWLLIKGKVRIADALSLALGFAVPTALFLGYNYATNGDPLTFGYTALHGRNFRLGSVAPPEKLAFARYMRVPSLRLITTLSTGFYSLNRYLFGWPLPSLLLATAPFALASRKKWDYLLLANLLSIPVLYAFFFRQDFFMGPRYYFEVIPAAVILTARGLQEAPELWKRFSGRMNNKAVSDFLAILLTLCLVFNAVSFFPARLRMYNISSNIYRGVPSPIWRHIESANIRNAVVLIDDLYSSLAYGAGLWRNDPSLKGDIVYAREMKLDPLGLVPNDGPIMALYPGRKYYRYRAVTDNFEEIFPTGISPDIPAEPPQ